MVTVDRRAGSLLARRTVGAPRPVRPPLSERARWSMLGFGGVAFTLVVASAPALMPAAVVAVWAIALVTVPRPVYLLADAVVVGSAVLATVLLADAPELPVEMTLALVLPGAIVLGHALHRHRTGAMRAVGDTAAADALLLDLRERARAHGGLPALPHGWLLDADLRGSGGDAFCGDFVLAARPDETTLDVVLVDVSGNGRVAAGRALLFTGAFGALLREVPAHGFLPAANRYVLRHGGDDGFATALHVHVDLPTGAWTVTSAGHPPAAHFHAGAGRWDLVDAAEGPPLGVLPDAAFAAGHGRLAAGDALMIYTDGMVESRRLDVGLGIDRLIGLAEPVLAAGAGAAAIAAACLAGPGDDRALVVLRRG